MPTNATRPTGPRSLATATSPDTPHALRGAPQLRTDPPCPLLSQCVLPSAQIGLFSAVVTAFTIKSYKWLQPNPLQIKMSFHQCHRPLPRPHQILVPELDAQSHGWACEQRLWHYRRDMSLSYEKVRALHQFQYERWGADILGALLPLLKFGVVLFIGLIDFLYGLGMDAAILVIIFIGAGIVFLFDTTMATPRHHGCCEAL
ncbi:hypothetical protein BD779DRAFT_1805709 [Infundibulicybe gibba]|nr:hypothetical protein BD779DRAFT_1805709 [Infundibulicybe gibba]